LPAELSAEYAAVQPAFIATVYTAIFAPVDAAKLTAQRSPDDTA
jgi:hypothetical protein